MILLVLRFVVPVMALLNQAVYGYFLQPQYETSQAVLEQSGYDIQQQQEADKLQPVPQDEAIFDKLKRAYNSVSNAIDIDGRLNKMKQTAAEMSERILDLMVVFLVQSLLFPLLLMWLAYRLLLHLLRLV